jgi:small-conductance mechanosensitive channel
MTIQERADEGELRKILSQLRELAQRRDAINSARSQPARETRPQDSSSRDAEKQSQLIREQTQAIKEQTEVIRSQQQQPRNDNALIPSDAARGMRGVSRER